MVAKIDDTYAEAFKSLYAEFLITARDRKWLDHAINAVTGNASSSILCDCEAGMDRYVGLGGDQSFKTPDDRPGAIVQLHIPCFRKDQVKALERSALVRISQNILTCPTASCGVLDLGRLLGPLGSLALGWHDLNLAFLSSSQFINRYLTRNNGLFSTLNEPYLFVQKD